MPFPRAASCSYISPPLGSLERLGAESRGYFSPGSRPRNPETGVPWPVVTQNVCARVCKCGCVCVRFLLISLGNLGVGLEVVGNGMSSSLSPSGGRNQEAGLVGPLIGGISVSVTVGSTTQGGAPLSSDVEVLEDLCLFPTLGLFPAAR